MNAAFSAGAVTVGCAVATTPVRRTAAATAAMRSADGPRVGATLEFPDEPEAAAARHLRRDEGRVEPAILEMRRAEQVLPLNDDRELRRPFPFEAEVGARV